MIARDLFLRIQKWMFQGKIIVLYGARQVGKTTMARMILEKYPEKKHLFLHCEDLFIQSSIPKKSVIELKSFFGDADIVVLDEAQTIPNIGKILKVFHDAFPEVQMIATGSSSFDLANSLAEPLTGRSLEFTLYPFSLHEILSVHSTLQIQSNLQKYILYGMYPEIVLKDGEIAKELLKDLSSKYLFRDILSFEGIKNSGLVFNILQAISYQLGNEVSYTELANTVGSNKNTVERYIHILEKSFILFTLPSLARNQRNEIRKTKKIYFYDTGIRNALINNFSDLSLRNDKGALLENFFIAEMWKRKRNFGKTETFYFWRTYAQQEIDLILEHDGNFEAFEVKWNTQKKVKIPSSFASHYPIHSFTVLNPDTLLEVIEKA